MLWKQVLGFHLKLVEAKRPAYWPQDSCLDRQSNITICPLLQRLKGVLPLLLLFSFATSAYSTLMDNSDMCCCQ